MKKWLVRGAIVAIATGGMLVAGPEYVAARICDQPEQPGTCPPFTTPSGNTWCVTHDYPEGGMCVGSCCTCFV